MKLKTVNFDKPVPLQLSAGRRLAHTLSIDDKHIERLEVVDGMWVLVEAHSQPVRLIPMSKVASVQPLQDQFTAGSAKRRGRPPGSKNKEKTNADRPPTEASLPSD